MRARSVNKKTFVQAFAMGLIGGPLCWIAGMGGGDLLWCCVAMFLTPILVDVLKS